MRCWRLARDIVGHEVNVARQMGWATTQNGELLALASEHFDVFVTVDQNLPLQQNLAAIPMAIIVLRATTNRLVALRALVPGLLAAIESAPRGIATLIDAPIGE
jgi:hypothetical protein